ncbi:hypothetical protein B0H13DRAFT_2652598 [Mycena leptocephala]|nr:hypothetical protein B0H13DRAFT_2652598 [Mycena leptocephala]
MSNTGSVAGLPLEFPNDAFEHGGFIDFTEGKTRYVFQYTFIHALPVQEWESLRVYLDANPILPLVDGELMLRLMINSIEKAHAVRLASRVEAPLSPGGAPSLWNVETLEARSAMAEGENLVLELGKRYVPKRSCSIASCRAWLPATGPDVCIVHLWDNIKSGQTTVLNMKMIYFLNLQYCFFH